MPKLPPTTQLYTANKIGLGGLNVFDNSKDLDDNELANVKNMVFTDGILQPRKGSLLYASKPVGETATPFQILVATNSVGVDYMIVCYGTNFYLWDTINKQWIKLNQAYSPASVNIFYGSTNWNNGTTDDRFYFGNGVDDNMKWIMAVDTLKNTTAAA